MRADQRLIEIDAEIFKNQQANASAEQLNVLLTKRAERLDHIEREMNLSPGLTRPAEGI